MLNSEHFNLIQRALDATANELKELRADASPSVISHAQNNLEKAVEHIHSTDHPFFILACDQPKVSHKKLGTAKFFYCIQRREMIILMV